MKANNIATFLFFNSDAVKKAINKMVETEDKM